LRVTQNHTTSLEDHGRQLTKTLGQMGQMIASAKAATGAAVSKRVAAVTSPTKEAAPPLAPTPSRQCETDLDAEVDRTERKLGGLRASLVEKCQTSKDGLQPQ